MARKSVQEQKEEALASGKVVSRGRSVGELIKLFKQSAHIEDLQLSETELKNLIDFGTDIDDQRRKILEETKKFVDPIKAMLKAHAKEHNWKTKEGALGECTIGMSTTTTTGTVTELAQLLKKEGKSKLLNSLVKIQIGEAKKYLGEDILFKSGFLQSDMEEFGTVSLKLRK